MKKTGGAVGLIDVTDVADRPKTKTIEIPIANAGAGADLSEYAIWRAPTAVTLVDIGIINKSGVASAVDGSNTSVHRIRNSGTTTVVTQTFNATTTFPAANAYVSLGALSVTAIAADDTLLYTLTNGANANLPAFALQIEYY